MIPIRWACSECDCNNGKHPAFNLYVPNRKNAVRSVSEPGAAWLCTNSECKHPARSHKFTFEKPKDENN